MEHDKSKAMLLSNLSLLMELLCTVSHVSTQEVSLLLIQKKKTHGGHSAVAELLMRESKAKIFSRSGGSSRGQRSPE